MSTYIYFIQRGDDGPIKIGQANNPYRRRHDLQISSPEPLAVRAMFLTPHATDEKQLHREFKDEHIAGEWFRPSERLLALMASYGALPARVECEGAERQNLRQSRDEIWEAAVKHDPRVAEICERAARVKDCGGSKFCATEVWHQDLKPELQRMASWNAGNPLFRSAKFFDAVFARVWRVMPPCRNCDCGA